MKDSHLWQKEASNYMNRKCIFLKHVIKNVEKPHCRFCTQIKYQIAKENNVSLLTHSNIFQAIQMDFRHTKNRAKIYFAEAADNKRYTR